MMKKTLVCCLSASIMLVTSACGSQGTASDVNSMETYGCDTLNVYNWGEYIDPATITDFESQYNVTVSYSLYDSNESMYTKLLSGASYDVLYPSDYMIERLIEENMLLPLDKSLIPNFDKMNPDYLGLPYDPENTYSIPYFAGTVGILYNTQNVDSAVVEEKGWEVYRDPQFKGRVAMYDSERDAFMVAFKALGYSMNTENDAEIQAAYQWLLDMNKLTEPDYMTDEVIDGMINSDHDIALVYSGDAAYIMSENPDMAYFEPTSGTNTWTDGMVIPANSKCSKLAHEYINYMSSDEAAITNSSFVGYTSANATAASTVGSENYDGINAYTPRVGYAKDEVFKHNDVLKKTLGDFWIRVKSAN